jgi:methylenetetrahydrofolate--tRNA-(uracil-5-)-methyltransferase
VLLPTLQSRANPALYFAGQICGVEGYVESIATGLLAGVNAARMARGLDPMTPPRETACGSLLNYIAFSEELHFQPANISFGLLPADTGQSSGKPHDRKERRKMRVCDALRQMREWSKQFLSGFLQIA